MGFSSSARWTDQKRSTEWTVNFKRFNTHHSLLLTSLFEPENELRFQEEAVILMFTLLRPQFAIPFFHKHCLVKQIRVKQ